MKLRVLLVSIAFFSVAVRAEFVLIVDFSNYTNPTGLCAECMTGLESVTSADQLVPVCCDESPFTSVNCDNTGEARCDTRFRWTIRPLGASLKTRPVSVPGAATPPYYFTDCNQSPTTCPFSEMSTTFSQGPTGFLGVAANPLPVEPRTNMPWTGSVQFFIEALDSGLPNIIDSLLINLNNLQLGADFTEEMTFTGYHNISHMTMSFRVECALGFCGADCTTTPQNNPRVSECHPNGTFTCADNRLESATRCNSCLHNLDIATNCRTCLDPNFDPETNCQSCSRPNFDVDEECTTCLTGYNPLTNCTQCLPNRDLSTNCTQCSPGWDISSDCMSCLPGRDPSTNCTQCLPNRDLSTNCTQCSPGWDISSDCTSCLPSRDVEFKCLECLPNRDLSMSCSTCLPGWDISSNCTSCLPRRDPATNCSLCLQPDQFLDIDCSVCVLPGGDPEALCQTCLLPGRDPSTNCECMGNREPTTNCSTCLPGWDSSYDCRMCLIGRSISTNCTSCIPGYSGDDCQLIGSPPSADETVLNVVYGTILGLLMLVIVILTVLLGVLLCCYKKDKQVLRSSDSDSEMVEMNRNGHSMNGTSLTNGDRLPVGNGRKQEWSL